MPHTYWKRNSILDDPLDMWAAFSVITIEWEMIPENIHTLLYKHEDDVQTHAREACRHEHKLTSTLKGTFSQECMDTS